MKYLSPKSITVMKYLGTDGECHYVEANDITFPSLEDRLNYLSQLEYKLWADDEIVEHEASQAIKACGMSSWEYRDILLNYNHYKRYVEAKYESVDKFMKKYKKRGY